MKRPFFERRIHEPKRVPAFEQAMKDFPAWPKVEHAAHPNTHKRYETSSKALRRFLGNAAFSP